MTEPEPARSAPTGDASYTREYVETLKAALDQKSEEASRLHAKVTLHESSRRSAIASMQPSINEYVEHLVNSNSEQADDFKAPMLDWVKNCHDTSSIEHTFPLAKMLSCASAGWKRQREEASALSDTSNTLSATLKELEEIKAERDSKVRYICELEAHVKNQAASAHMMQDKLFQTGQIKEKFDFSKASSRESVSDASPCALAASAAALPDMPLHAITSQASRAPARFNDDLMAFVCQNGANAHSSRFVPQQSKRAQESVDDEISRAYSVV